MSAAAVRIATGSRRERVLRVFGITPWQLRASFSQGASLLDAQGAGDSAATACALVLPDGCGARALDLIGRASSAYGAELARAARIHVAEGGLVGTVPQARAYLVFGEAQARALGRELPAATMHQAQIVLVDEPDQVLTQAASKRRLWSALRQLRRALTASAD